MGTKQSSPRQEPPQQSEAGVEGEEVRSKELAGLWQEGESSGSHGDSGLIPSSAKREGRLRGEAGPQLDSQVSVTGSVVSQARSKHFRSEKPLYWG